MIIPKYMGVTDAAGYTESIALADIAKIVREQDEAILYFRDGSTLPIRVGDAERILKWLPEFELVAAKTLTRLDRVQ